MIEREAREKKGGVLISDFSHKKRFYKHKFYKQKVPFFRFISRMAISRKCRFLLAE